MSCFINTALSVYLIFVKIKKQIFIIYTRVITPKRITSGMAHLRGLAPRQRSSTKTSQRWRAVGDTVFVFLIYGENTFF